MGISVRRRRKITDNDMKHFENMMRKDVEKQQRSQAPVQQQPQPPMQQQPLPQQMQQEQQEQYQDEERAYICTLISQEHVLSRAIVVADSIFDAMSKVAERFRSSREDLPTLTIKVDIADVIQ